MDTTRRSRARRVGWWTAITVGAIIFVLTSWIVASGARIDHLPLQTGDLILLLVAASATILPATLTEWWKPRWGGFCLILTTVVSFDAVLLLCSTSWAHPALFLFPMSTLLFGLFFVITAEAELRFSLRALLLGIAVVAAVCWLIGANRSQLRAQRRAAEALQTAGFQIRCDELGVPMIVRGDVRTPGMTDVAAGNMRAIAAATEVAEIHLHGAGVIDTDLVHFSELHRLHRLDLRRTKVTNAGLVHLEDLDELVWISFESTKVDRSGVERLKKHLPRTRVFWGVEEAVDRQFMD